MRAELNFVAQWQELLFLLIVMGSGASVLVLTILWYGPKRGSGTTQYAGLTSYPVRSFIMLVLTRHTLAENTKLPE